MTWKRFYSQLKNSAVHNPPPLDGIRVLDMTRILAGPYCTMILGDLGADVIKIEEPTKGDDTRGWGPPFAKSQVDGFPDESAYFLAVNRNKRSVAVDIKKADGLKIIKDLVKVSDVFVENFVPGKLASLGLGYEELSKINPRLVYASITGYGPTGPYSKHPGYDVIIEAEAGLMHITGEPTGEPVKVGVAITDLTTGLYAHGAILASLFARERSGRGQKVDLSLIESQIASLANIGSNYLIGEREASRQGTQHASIVPYQRFKTKDGQIVFGAGNDRQFEVVCGVLGMKEVAVDPKFKTNMERVKNRTELIAKIQSALMKQSTDFWYGKLQAIGIPVGPVNNIAQTFQHPQVIHRDMIMECDHPTVGKIKLAGIPSDYSDTPPRLRMAPPTHGQHTFEVLQDVLAYENDKIAKLKQNQIIK